MTLKYFLIRLEEAWCKTSIDMYRWLEIRDIAIKEAITLKNEVESANKVDELWEVYQALTMYIKYNKE